MARIRDDFTGAVHITDRDGVAVFLTGGDEVPEHVRLDPSLYADGDAPEPTPKLTGPRNLSRDEEAAAIRAGVTEDMYHRHGADYARGYTAGVEATNAAAKLAARQHGEPEPDDVTPSETPAPEPEQPEQPQQPATPEQPTEPTPETPAEGDKGPAEPEPVVVEPVPADPEQPTPADDVEQQPVAPTTYDPTVNTVKAVNAHLDAHPDEVAAVMALEAASPDPRQGILAGPHAQPKG